jgi:hypothetical protein
MIFCASLLPVLAGENGSIRIEVDATCRAKRAQANHNNIKLNPVFRGMLR